MRVVDLKALAKECRLRGYSRLRKVELIGFIQQNARPPPALHTRPPRPPGTHEQRPTRGFGAPTPQRAASPPSLVPPPQLHLVRFRPDKPRQPTP